MSYDTLRCYSLVLISSVTCLMPLWGLRDGYSVLVNHFHEINLGRIIQQLMNFIINLWKRSCIERFITHRDVGQCQVKCTVRPNSPTKYALQTCLFTINHQKFLPIYGRIAHYGGAVKQKARSLHGGGRCDFLLIIDWLPTALYSNL